MSQRARRLSKKVKQLSEQYDREREVNMAIDMATSLLNSLYNELDELWDEYNSQMAYIYKNDDAEISYDLLEMPDGTKIEVTILESDDSIMVAYKGLVGKSKKHKHDKFDFNIGYNLAATRLMMKIMEAKYM